MPAPYSTADLRAILANPIGSPYNAGVINSSLDPRARAEAQMAISQAQTQAMVARESAAARPGSVYRPAVEPVQQPQIVQQPRPRGSSGLGLSEPPVQEVVPSGRPRITDELNAADRSFRRLI